MPDDEAPGGNDEVVVFETDEVESDEANPHRLAKSPPGLPSAVYVGLTEQLEKSAVLRVLRSQMVQDAMASTSNTLGQLDSGLRFTDAIGMSPALTSVSEIMAMDIKLFDEAMVGLKLTPREYALTAALTKDVFRAEALTRSRAIESSFALVLKPFLDPSRFHPAWADDLMRVSAAQTKLMDWVVNQDTGTQLIGEISARPLRLWQAFADLIPAQPDAQWLRTSVAAGNALSGLLGADVLESDFDDPELVRTTIQQVELEVLGASEPGRLRAAQELYRRLGDIDPTVPDLLEGAWEEIERDGPAAASKAAHCIVEVLDRTLRAAAPDEDVREWHTRTGRNVTEFSDQGKVTRALRVRYLASNIGGVKELVVAQYESLTKVLAPLQGRLEGVKHASTAEVFLVRSLLLTAEGFLAVLFLNTTP